MSESDLHALDQLVARVRHAEQRAREFDEQTLELATLRERVAADAVVVGELRAQVAAAKAVEADLEAANVRIERLLARVANAERRRDSALATEAEATARLRALEGAVAQARAESDRAVEDLRRFRNLRWNRLGIALRRPVNRARSMVGR